MRARAVGGLTGPHSAIQLEFPPEPGSASSPMELYVSHSASIDRANPAAVLFLIDQSASMADRMASGLTKAEQVCNVLNRTIKNLIARCIRAKGDADYEVRDYFHVGVLGYGANGPRNALNGALSESVMNPISLLEKAPLRIEEKMRRVDDGAGGVLQQPIKFEVWVEPSANGGTPMCAALLAAAEELAAWCQQHENSYPPTLLHITDGESTDGDPCPLAADLRSLRTQDGEVLLFNLHISSRGDSPILFPETESGLPDPFAELLFRMSSQLPSHLVEFASTREMTLSPQSRGFVFNADAVQIVDFFDIGTRPTQLR